MSAAAPLPAATSATAISHEGRAQLLDMSLAGLVFGLSCMPVAGAPLVAWLVLADRPFDLLLVWTLAYVAAAVGVQWMHRRYRAARRQQAAQEVLARWQPRAQTLALAHGLGLTCAVVALLATPGAASFELMVVLYATVAAAMASNAAHQTATFGVYQRFFVAGWGGYILLAPWSLAPHWPVALPLLLLYCGAVYRHALVTHRFFVQQVRMEEEGAHLAERYRVAKEQAETALREKNLFLSTAAHDLRQPVHAAGLLARAITLRNHDAALAPLLADLQLSVQATQRMSHALLDLSRIESGSLAVQAGPVLLAALFDELRLQFAGQTGARGLALRWHAPPAGATVRADPALLRQSLSNLVHNALHYTQRGGVLVGARRRAGHWRLEVWDTGVGVALEDQDRIYAPFYRPQLAWHADRAGHGLGLAVVARCATLMGAQHGLQSRLGRGSCFWLSLPAAPAEAGQAATQHATPSAPRLRGDCLVLDDDPHVLDAWSALMAAWGVRAHLARDAHAAFALLDAGLQPHAILCDQRLRSGESGFDVLRALLARWPQARGAMVSGEFDSPQLREAEAEGYLVLHKPVETDALQALLVTWMESATEV